MKTKMQNSFKQQRYDCDNIQSICNYYNEIDDSDTQIDRMAFEIYFLNQQIHHLEKKLNYPEALLAHLRQKKLNFIIQDHGSELLELLLSAMDKTYYTIKGCTAFEDIPEVQDLQEKIAELENAIPSACDAIQYALDNDLEIQKEIQVDREIKYQKECKTS